jgi:DNA-binding FadR family transcriptional regulator
MVDLRVPKMAELIARDLRRKIVSGTYAPGESLPSEAQLILDYEVSRPTLREALRLIEMDQLITVRRGSHRGAVVRLPDTSVAVRNTTMLLELRGATLADVYTARLTFEPPACAMAAELATADAIAALRSDVDEHAKLDPADYPASAWQFHTKLVELSGNVTLAVVATTLQHISQQHSDKVMSVSSNQAADQHLSLAAHRRILDLIEAHAATEAEQFWRRHMEGVGQHLRTVGQDLVIELLD